MGFYIDKDSTGKTLNSLFKADQLIKDGAVEVEPKWQENLICVMINATFDAAAYCYSEKEFEHLKKDDGRYKIWLTHPKAKELADYEE